MVLFVWETLAQDLLPGVVPDHRAGTTCSVLFLHPFLIKHPAPDHRTGSQLALMLFSMSSLFACRGLWRGTSPTILRLTVGVSTQFFALELIKDAFARHRHIGKENQSLSPWEAFFAGGCISSFGLCLPAFASVFLKPAVEAPQSNLSDST